MSGKRINFSDQGATLSCVQWGHGPRALLAFHGFGQSSSLYLPLLHRLPQHTIYSFDLFHHGMSTMPTAKALEPHAWHALMSQFFERQAIDRFDLLAFSFGGRFAMATLAALPTKVDQVHLVAPDGITNSPWYTLATRYKMMRSFFRLIVDRPRWFYAYLKTMEKMALLRGGLGKFATQAMSTREQRQRVYNTWMSARKLHIPTGKLGEIINMSEGVLHIFIGAYDLVIPEKRVDPLCRQVSRCTLHKLPVGHRLVLQQYLDRAATIFYEQESGVE
jgi:pimeloyl-ACP methyl ester carboxylesterase